METQVNQRFDMSAIRQKVAEANARKASDGGDEISFDFAKLDAAVKNDWETQARATLIRMFEQAKLEENFSFKVAPGTADHYVNAMRSVMSRVRKKATKNKKTVEDFKLLVVGITNHPTHDAVTLVRTKTSSGKAKSAYDELLGFVTAESEEK